MDYSTIREKEVPPFYQDWIGRIGTTNRGDHHGTSKGNNNKHTSSCTTISSTQQALKLCFLHKVGALEVVADEDFYEHRDGVVLGERGSFSARSNSPGRRGRTGAASSWENIFGQAAKEVDEAQDEISENLKNMASTTVGASTSERALEDPVWEFLTRRENSQLLEWFLTSGPPGDLNKVFPQQRARRASQTGTNGGATTSTSTSSPRHQSSRKRPQLHPHEQWCSLMQEAGDPESWQAAARLLALLLQEGVESCLDELDALVPEWERSVLQPMKPSGFFGGGTGLLFEDYALARAAEADSVLSVQLQRSGDYLTNLLPPGRDHLAGGTAVGGRVVGSVGKNELPGQPAEQTGSSSDEENDKYGSSIVGSTKATADEAVPAAATVAVLARNKQAASCTTTKGNYGTTKDVHLAKKHSPARSTYLRTSTSDKTKPQGSREINVKPGFAERPSPNFARGRVKGAAAGVEDGGESSSTRTGGEDEYDKNDAAVTNIGVLSCCLNSPCLLGTKQQQLSKTSSKKHLQVQAIFREARAMMRSGGGSLEARLAIAVALTYCGWCQNRFGGGDHGVDSSNYRGSRGSTSAAASHYTPPRLRKSSSSPKRNGSRRSAGAGRASFSSVMNHSINQSHKLDPRKRLAEMFVLVRRPAVRKKLESLSVWHLRFLVATPLMLGDYSSTLAEDLLWLEERGPTTTSTGGTVFAEGGQGGSRSTASTSATSGAGARQPSVASSTYEDKYTDEMEDDQSSTSMAAGGNANTRSWMRPLPLAFPAISAEITSVQELWRVISSSFQIRTKNDAGVAYQHSPDLFFHARPLTLQNLWTTGGPQEVLLSFFVKLCHTLCIPAVKVGGQPTAVDEQGGLVDVGGRYYSPKGAGAVLARDPATGKWLEFRLQRTTTDVENVDDASFSYELMEMSQRQLVQSLPAGAAERLQHPQKSTSTARGPYICSEMLRCQAEMGFRDLIEASWCSPLPIQALATSTGRGGTHCENLAEVYQVENSNSTSSSATTAFAGSAGWLADGSVAWMEMDLGKPCVIQALKFDWLAEPESIEVSAHHHDLCRRRNQQLLTGGTSCRHRLALDDESATEILPRQTSSACSSSSGENHSSDEAPPEDGALAHRLTSPYARKRSPDGSPKVLEVRTLSPERLRELVGQHGENITRNVREASAGGQQTFLVDSPTSPGRRQIRSGRSAARNTAEVEHQIGIQNISPAHSRAEGARNSTSKAMLTTNVHEDHEGGALPPYLRSVVEQSKTLQTVPATSASADGRSGPAWRLLDTHVSREEGGFVTTSVIRLQGLFGSSSSPGRQREDEDRDETNAAEPPSTPKAAAADEEATGTARAEILPQEQLLDQQHDITTTPLQLPILRYLRIDLRDAVSSNRLVRERCSIGVRRLQVHGCGFSEHRRAKTLLQARAGRVCELLFAAVEACPTNILAWRQLFWILTVFVHEQVQETKLCSRNRHAWISEAVARARRKNEAGTSGINSLAVTHDSVSAVLRFRMEEIFAENKDTQVLGDEKSRRKSSETSHQVEEDDGEQEACEVLEQPYILLDRLWQEYIRFSSADCGN
ncbi:unnamed protein product [Amoebophrya sp. A120]|nr:unnamed protein product [Amoebophrya sp. A120]|eukprot:GSA120T00018213001.1